MRALVTPDIADTTTSGGAFFNALSISSYTCSKRSFEPTEVPPKLHYYHGCFWFSSSCLASVDIGTERAQALFETIVTAVEVGQSGDFCNSVGSEASDDQRGRRSQVGRLDLGSCQFRYAFDDSAVCFSVGYSAPILRNSPTCIKRFS